MNKHHLFLLLLCIATAAAIFLTSACADQDDDDDSSSHQGDDDDSADDDDSHGNIGWRLWKTPDVSLKVFFDDREMFELLYVERLEFTPKVTSLFGIFKLKKRYLITRSYYLGEWIDDTTIMLMENDDRVGELSFEVDNTKPLRVTVKLDEYRIADGLRLYFRLNNGDRFWGFGEQYNYVDMRGQALDVWVSEQGLGRREHPLFPPFGSYTTTYFPMPYFMDPEQGKGFLLTGHEYSRFDLGNSDEEMWHFEVWNGEQTEFLVFPGPQPKDVISQLTAEVGRPERIPPDWAFSGPWIAAQGGTEAVRERLEIAQENDIPLTALWVQDWLGQRDFGFRNFGVKYHWSLDEGLYPDLPEFIEEAADEGVRFLGYFNPFVVKRYEHFAEMDEDGMLIEKANGLPYMFLISTFTGTLVDVSDEAAVDYFQDYARLATDMGQKGWMCDFGEWLPFDAVIDAGDAPDYHNIYPENWHRINREVLEEAYPDGDWVMFTRSGYTYDHKVAQIVWAGDQETNWSREDGLPTVVTAGLTIGLGGIPFFTHDIGGFSGGPRSKELFMRWTELGAFTPVMRTHDGLKKLENHHFDSDQETLDHFAFFSKLHKALLPVWLELADEAVEDGLPIIRHTALVDPGWEKSYGAHEQWMLGDDILVVPVVEQGAEMVTVRFPEGTWRHIATGETYEGRTLAQVKTPLYFPAAFVREGAWEEVVDDVETLYEQEGLL